MKPHDVEFRYRPIESYPGERTAPALVAPSPFASSYSDTMLLLRRELGYVVASNPVVIQLDLKEGQIRQDGLPYASARPRSGLVVISFESKEAGHLQFACDRYAGSPAWHENLRAIALGLESLRRVDRYGIGRGGEQYTGWQALPSGEPRDNVQAAAQFIAEHGGAGREAWKLVVEREDTRIRWCREAARRLHPDRGGDASLFHRLQEAKATLERRT